jgi:outer membrane receptor protein involved in Fe transport
MLAVLLLALIVTADQAAPAGRATLVDSRTGRPLARAEVTIVGSRGAIRADEHGRFEWPALATGVVVLVILLPDGRMAPPVVAVVDRAAPMRIAVDTAVSETVRVQGVAPAIDVAGAASLGVLSADDIRLRHPATLAQALDDLPGVRAISEGQAQTPAIRGLARGRTLVLLDGLRVSTERGAGTNASFLDPADLGRVDVARGPGSVAYGSDAFGGVVAATTRQPVADSPMRVTFGGTLGAGVP